MARAAAISASGSQRQRGVKPIPWMLWRPSPVEKALRLARAMWRRWRRVIRDQAWRCGRSTSSPQVSQLHARELTSLARPYEFSGHIPDQDGRIVLQLSNGIQKTIPCEQAALFFARIANTGENPEQVQSDRSFVVVKLLSESRKKIWSG